MRIGTRGSALALSQAAWVARRLGEQAEIVRITTAGDRAQRQADKSRWVESSNRRCSNAASTSPCTPPRTCLPSWRRDCRSSRSRRGRTRATRSAAPRHSMSFPPGRVSAPVACGAPRSSGRCARTCRSSLSPGTSTRGCASSRRAPSTPSCWRWRVCAGLVVRPRREACWIARAGSRSGRAGDRGATGSDPGRAARGAA